MMMSPPGRAPLTFRQRWWREERHREIEDIANRAIRGYERAKGPIGGCVVSPELVALHLGCEMVYFDDDEQAEYGIPLDAIGALKPAEAMIFVYQRLAPVGREWQTIGEELGHYLLHAKDKRVRGQGELALDIGDDGKGSSTFFCRTPDAAFMDDALEPTWISREAAFFAACLQMPRDRFGPVARRRLVNAVAEAIPFWGESWVELDQRVQHGTTVLAEIRDLSGCGAPWSKDFDVVDDDKCAHVLPLFDDVQVALALEALRADHQRQVSDAAQRRRFVELGLVHDAADLFFGSKGAPLFRRDEHYLLADAVIEEARRLGEASREASVQTTP